MTPREAAIEAIQDELATRDMVLTWRALAEIAVDTLLKEGWQPPATQSPGRGAKGSSSPSR